MTTRSGLLVCALLTTLAACSSAAPPTASLRTWGSMREALRDGHSEARVELSALTGPTTIGVGALAGLNGEITVVDGRTLVATTDATAATSGDRRPHVRPARAGDRATLLVLDEVPAWREYQLPACGSYDELEDRIAAVLRDRGHDLTQPIAVRVRGDSSRLALHVIAGACPIANPDGPAPWRFEGPAEHVELVGFFVEGAAGVLTHHLHRSHLHAVCEQAMGHLDDVVFEQAVTLLLPARS